MPKASGRISGAANEIAEASRLARRELRDRGRRWVGVRYVAHDLEVGAGLFGRALVLNSDLTEVWSFGGWAKNWLGEPKEAIERFGRSALRARVNERRHMIALRPRKHREEEKSNPKLGAAFLGRPSALREWRVGEPPRSSGLSRRFLKGQARLLGPPLSKGPR
jgi:hypothetical protein